MQFFHIRKEQTNVIKFQYSALQTLQSLQTLRDLGGEAGKKLQSSKSANLSSRETA